MYVNVLLAHIPYLYWNSTCD